MHIGIRARSGVICGVPAHLLVGGFGGNPGGFPIIMNLPVSTDEAAERFSAVLGQEEFLAELDLGCHADWSSSPRQIRLRPLKEHVNSCTFEIAIETTPVLGRRRTTRSQRHRQAESEPQPP